MPRARVLLALAIACASGMLHAQADSQSDRAAAVLWARGALVPLSASASDPTRDFLGTLDRLIGDASVVALGEGVHAAAEPLEFRNRVIEYLVTEKGFTAIALESGLVEGRTVHDHVRGGAGELNSVMAEGFSWTFDRLPQNWALVQWLRDYNANSRHPRKVNLYGFDIAGSPGNPGTNRGVDTALNAALQYLDRVDRAAAEAIHTRLDPLLPRLRFEFNRATKGAGYDRLNQEQRDTLTAAIADLIALLEHREGRYTADGSIDDYEWGYRAAISARQIDSWLRQMPMEWRPFGEQIANLSVANDVRDRAQADNLDWILNREGKTGRVLIFAHSVHLSRTPVTTVWWSPTGNGQRERYEYRVAGTYLHRRLGGRLISIGNVIGNGKIGCAGFKQTIAPAPVDSIAGMLGEASRQSYLLDLRAAPAAVTNWLDRQRRLGPNDEVFDMREAFELSVGSAYDVIYYLDSVTPACSD